ncbi:YbaB/EbfC family nucleoid-associated protein [Candidatus Dojkabacteria bacterium]|nr:YbaB/EbfC family nucleoid-associated protein [Candidatus Dojkabacteria bacterium]
MAFSQMKDLYRLQKEARKMQKQMKKMTVEGTSKDELVRVTINGIQEIDEIDIDEELLNPARKVDLIKGIKQAIKEAGKKVQKEMAKDMDMDRMRSMLGS